MDETVVSGLVATGVTVAIGLGAYWLLSRLGVAWVDRMGRRGREDAARASTLWSMIRQVVAVVVGIIVVLTILSIWDISLTPFVAVGSAVGVAVGLGAQGLVADVIAGFFMLAEDQFSIGDWISVAGVDGEVSEIRLRVTVLRDIDGNAHYVPNGEIRVTTNMTKVQGQVVIDLKVASGSPIPQVLEFLREELTDLGEDAEWQERIRGEPEILGVQDLDGLGVTVRALMPTTPDGKWSVRREALRRISERFDEEGIELPIPPYGGEV
ncbi:MAG: mechanosensitive ion channel [Acidimicrobiia bacterium]|nr:mechanosensitive ion channel [Acidimicrobiia bacterium]